MKSFWRLVPIGLFAILALLFWRALSLDPHKLPSIQVGRKLPSFVLPNMDHGALTAQTFLGKITLLNIWASWCPSCSEEQHFLLQLAQQGIVIYGLNYKDDPKDAIQWLSTWGNPYREIGLDREGKIAIDLGVYGTPETFLIDQEGIIRYRHAGLLNAAVWAQEFLPRIHTLESEAS